MILIEWLSSHREFIGFAAIIIAFALGIAVTKSAWRGQATLLTPQQMRDLLGARK